jgi:hypothetical protein
MPGLRADITLTLLQVPEREEGEPGRLPSSSNYSDIGGFSDSSDRSDSSDKGNFFLHKPKIFNDN